MGSGGVPRLGKVKGQQMAEIDMGHLKLILCASDLKTSFPPVLKGQTFVISDFLWTHV